MTIRLVEATTLPHRLVKATILPHRLVKATILPHPLNKLPSWVYTTVTYSSVRLRLRLVL